MRRDAWLVYLVCLVKPPLRVFNEGLPGTRVARAQESLRSAFAYLFKGSPIDPRLRASNEHILIVRVPRAGGRPGCIASSTPTIY